uniref:Uncharacterized protein n=1 Tax=Heterorhabditis bacteriophora TaxID=37862 RepID=A0A1I7WWZ4_HETBA
MGNSYSGKRSLFRRITSMKSFMDTKKALTLFNLPKAILMYLFIETEFIVKKRGQNNKQYQCAHSTCNIVSKLNAVPFQRVNSPVDAPVIKRLPSGVH